MNHHTLSSKGLFVVYKPMSDLHVLSASLASMYHGPVTLTLADLELTTNVGFLGLCAVSSSWKDPLPRNSYRTLSYFIQISVQICSNATLLKYVLLVTLFQVQFILLSAPKSSVCFSTACLIMWHHIIIIHFQAHYFSLLFDRSSLRTRVLYMSWYWL